VAATDQSSKKSSYAASQNQEDDALNSAACDAPWGQCLAFKHNLDFSSLTITDLDTECCDSRKTKRSERWTSCGETQGSKGETQPYRIIMRAIENQTIMA